MATCSSLTCTRRYENSRFFKRAEGRRAASYGWNPLDDRRPACFHGIYLISVCVLRDEVILKTKSKYKDCAWALFPQESPAGATTLNLNTQGCVRTFLSVQIWCQECHSGDRSWSAVSGRGGGEQAAGSLVRFFLSYDSVLEPHWGKKKITKNFLRIKSQCYDKCLVILWEKNQQHQKWTLSGNETCEVRTQNRELSSLSTVSSASPHTVLLSTLNFYELINFYKRSPNPGLRYSLVS